MAINEDAYYIDQLYQSGRQNLVVIKGGPDTQEMFGFIDGPSTFGASASWDTSIPLRSVDEGVESAGKAFANFTGSDEVMRSFRMTMVTWQNSTFNAVPFSIIVIANKIGINPLDEVKKVWDYVLPGEYGGGFFQSTPGGYTVNAAGQQTNQVSIWIGDWFKSMDAWVISAAQVEVSKQRVKDTNIPLYAKIDMTLLPSREFHKDEVKAWFIGR